MLTRAARLLRQMRKGADGVVGINRRNVELIYANNARHHYRYADDKLLAKASLEAAHVPVPKTLAVCDGLYSVSDTIRTLRDHGSFVIKPSTASGGKGILVLSERGGASEWLTPSGRMIDLDALKQHLADIVFGVFSTHMSDVAYAEPLVRPHETLRRLWPDGLCDLRVLTLDAVPFMAMLRIPTRASDGKANLHQGGIGAAVDLATGRVVRALSRGEGIERHPESGVELRGLHIPCWGECLDVARAAAKAVPLGYLGVDIVVNEEGRPLVLEVNVRPGLEIQNIHGRSIEDALKEVWS